MANQVNIGLYELRNSDGMRVTITNLGARIVSVFVRDRKNDFRDIVLGFDKAEDYLPENHKSDFGAVVGRYANRLAGGRILVDGKEYILPQNDGPNCLHGGPMGWQYSLYDVVSYESNKIALKMVSPDGDNGFPGRVEVSVTYSLGEDNSLRVDYYAVSDRPTVINMTNHSYFNLNGADKNEMPIDNHLLMIDADSYLPVDDTMIPTGVMADVTNTPYDFRSSQILANVFATGFEPMVNARGIDHCFVMNLDRCLDCLAARLMSPQTGIVMDLFTTEPGAQVYTGNFLDGVTGKYGLHYNQRMAICLETQQFPDSPNQHWTCSTGRLLPEKPYSSSTVFKFSIDK